MKKYKYKDMGYDATYDSLCTLIAGKHEDSYIVESMGNTYAIADWKVFTKDLDKSFVVTGLCKDYLYMDIINRIRKDGRRMSMKYKEINKLREMLEKENIPHLFFNRGSFDNIQYQIKYYGEIIDETENFVCSVVQGRCSYGGQEDLLEIMGLLTNEERKEDGVAGYLKAEDVFNRIKEHYKGEQI